MWTRKAVTYAGFGTILVLFAPFINNLQLLLLGITLLGFVAIHSLVNTRPVEVKITRRFSDSQLFEGQETEVDLVIQNRGRPIGCLEVYDQLPRELGPEKVANHTIVRLRRDEALLARYHLECHLRGQYTLGRPLLRLYNPSFLFYHESEVDSTDELVVFPKIEEIEGLDLSSDFPKMYQGAIPIRRVGTSGEFYSIREYHPGDDFKNINWRVFGRTRKLMVNQFEREDISDVMLVLDTREISGTGTPVHNPLNYSCRAAAALTRYFLHTRNRVGLTIYGETVESISVDSGERHMYRLLTRLAELRPAGSLGLHTVIGDLRNFTPRSPVIVISTLEQDRTVHSALREITAHGFRLTLIAPDTLEYDRESRIISPAVYFTASAELDNTIAEARSLGARALRWDPSSVLGPALQEVVR
ncbi:MAG: DUF58 domain-containing protein [Candidatus Poseidoniia archaeon]|jgi:uncharacterized protein (DUF58 family)|nr:hypothetical protein [Euryarchaeota archaeon]MDP6533715.1 DUF58 domain-containing protein [Candidatus Poseidoniia archaeon]HIH79308.1 DUF58 domain-containing protein [Candidatus Poseidoniia archaeon]